MQVSVELSLSDPGPGSAMRSALFLHFAGKYDSDGIFPS